MKNGHKIRICDMTDSHLVNTIKLLERKADAAHQEALSAAYSCSSFLQGEMACYYAERDIDYMESEGPEGLLEDTIYDNLVLDAERRGLTW